MNIAYSGDLSIFVNEIGLIIDAYDVIDTNASKRYFGTI